MSFRFLRRVVPAPSATRVSRPPGRMLPANRPLEEDTWAGYRAKDSFPVEPGQQFDNYQVISKLGWSPYGTMWLARDLKR